MLSYKKYFTFWLGTGIMRTMERLIFLRKDPLAAAVIVCLFAVGLIGLPYESVGGLLSNDPLDASLSGMIVCRTVGLAAMLFLYRRLGFSFDLRLRKGSFLAILPALLVAVNNAPLIALFSGTAGVTAGAEQLILFALECVFVASFEEMTFRGIVFPLLLSRFGAGKRERASAVLASSLLFGLMHLVNLISGAGVGETFLQAGYTFLIGAMFAVVLLCTGDLVVCIVLHTVYNFGGMLVPTLGYGSFFDLWSIPAIAVTALIGAAAIVFYLFALLRLPKDCAERLYRLSARQRFVLNGAFMA